MKNQEYNNGRKPSPEKMTPDRRRRLAKMLGALLVVFGGLGVVSQLSSQERPYQMTPPHKVEVLRGNIVLGPGTKLLKGSEAPNAIVIGDPVVETVPNGASIFVKDPVVEGYQQSSYPNSANTVWLGFNDIHGKNGPFVWVDAGAIIQDEGLPKVGGKYLFYPQGSGLNDNIVNSPTGNNMASARLVNGRYKLDNNGTDVAYGVQVSLNPRTADELF